MDFTLNVFFQNNDYVKQLEAERDAALKRAADAVRRASELETRCVDEKQVNIQLIDLLHANGIRYRPSADMRTWEWGG